MLRISDGIRREEELVDLEACSTCGRFRFIANFFPMEGLL